MEEIVRAIIKEAKRAYKKNEIPVGAVITKESRIISTGSNTRQYKYTVIGHAEINCILKAEKKNKDWRLDGYEMYVTLEPCDMCKKIIEEARVDKVYYILPKKEQMFGKRCEQLKVSKEVYAECENMIKNYFEKLRQ